MAEIQPGDRLLIAKHKATVRYLGPVDGHDGIWAGVEWDDSSRGKHDGATGGRRYFSCCSAAPTAASFIRIHKVAPGTSLVEALTLRYTNQLAEGQGGLVDAQQAYVSTASNKKLWVELVGQEQVTARQSKLELLTSARLVGANVSSVVRTPPYCCSFTPCLGAVVFLLAVCLSTLPAYSHDIIYAQPHSQYLCGCRDLQGSLQPVSRACSSWTSQTTSSATGAL